MLKKYILVISFVFVVLVGVLAIFAGSILMRPASLTTVSKVSLPSATEAPKSLVKTFNMKDLSGKWVEKGFVDRFIELKSFAKALDSNVNIFELDFVTKKSEGNKMAFVPCTLEEGNVETYIKETSEANTFSTKREDGDYKMVLSVDLSGRDLLSLSINGKPEAVYVKIISRGDISVESYVNQNLLVGTYKDEKGNVYDFSQNSSADWAGRKLKYVTGQTFDYFDFDVIHLANNKDKNLYYGFEWKDGKLVLFKTKFNGDMQQLGRLGNIATLTRAIDESDFTILPFALNMTFEQFKDVIKDNPIITSSTENADALEEGATFTTYKLKDGTLISFWEYKDKVEISAIEITSENYKTPRGLKVGDSISTLQKLYGKPSDISKAEYRFNDGYMYDIFTVKIKDNKVFKIRVNLIC